MEAKPGLGSGNMSENPKLGGECFLPASYLAHSLEGDRGGELGAVHVTLRDGQTG